MVYIQKADGSSCSKSEGAAAAAAAQLHDEQTPDAVMGLHHRAQQRER